MAFIFTYTTYTKDRRFDKVGMKILMLQKLKEKKLLLLHAQA